MQNSESRVGTSVYRARPIFDVSSHGGWLRNLVGPLLSMPRGSCKYFENLITHTTQDWRGHRNPLLSIVRFWYNIKKPYKQQILRALHRSGWFNDAGVGSGFGGSGYCCVADTDLGSCVQKKLEGKVTTM